MYLTNDVFIYFNLSPLALHVFNTDGEKVCLFSFKTSSLPFVGSFFQTKQINSFFIRLCFLDRWTWKDQTKTKTSGWYKEWTVFQFHPRHLPFLLFFKEKVESLISNRIKALLLFQLGHICLIWSCRPQKLLMSGPAITLSETYKHTDVLL